MCHLATELRRGRGGGCLVRVMQDGNEFASLCCSHAILEWLTSENAGPSRKIRSFTRAGQRLLSERVAARAKTKELQRVALFIQGRVYTDLSKMNKMWELNTVKAKKLFNRDLRMT